jgi:branched-subunit amino acid transport protein
VIAAASRNLLATIGGGFVLFFLLRWAFGQLPL